MSAAFNFCANGQVNTFDTNPPTIFNTICATISGTLPAPHTESLGDVFGEDTFLF